MTHVSFRYGQTVILFLKHGVIEERSTSDFSHEKNNNDAGVDLWSVCPWPFGQGL